MVCKLQHLPGSAQFANNRLFAGIAPELLNEIGAEMDLLQYDPGDIIFNENDPGDSMYLVGQGRVKISKLGRGGQQEMLGIIEPGSFFGEMALFDGQPRSAQASAVETTILGSVNDEMFQNILEVAPSSLHMNFLHSVTDRLRRVNTHFISEVMRNERLSLVGSMANAMIHDLKSPISVIRCCADLLAAKNNNPACLEFTDIINKSLDGMMSMTQELLDFARGKTCVNLENVMIERVLSELDVQTLQLIPERIHLVKDIRYNGTIRADCSRLVRALMNLMKNALESMSQRGILKLSVFPTAENLHFVVTDTGCGISPELQAKIFEPFVTYGKQNGSGLGMAIVKSVVEAHNGSISVESEIGAGTRIEIRLPRSI
ncbi:MAG: hypothetical protein QOD99_1446 [Chthoniobacter sp.]|jgi:signal transduction histidine kinase|nr:hypothetical protein [Chthoniobacter sp.]